MKLRPCPFCGSKQIGKGTDTVLFDIWGRHLQFCFCKKCGAQGERNADIVKAINAWNRRTNYDTDDKTD